MEEALLRGWTNFLHRLDGPLHFRFIVQPAVAVFFAIRAGLRDAAAKKETPFLSALRHRERVREHLRRAWSDVGKVFVVALVIDAVYQSAFQRGIYLLELLVTATVLALLPYALVRGPAEHIARFAHEHWGVTR
jgi:hypothetical protein